MNFKTYSPDILKGSSSGAELHICLLGTRGDINLGAVARLARNFGVSALHLVAPEAPRHGVEYEFACKGADLLSAAKVYSSLSEVAALEFDWIIGTTGKTGKNRRVVSVKDVVQDPSVNYSGQKILLVFGRESRGIYQDEAAHCDLLVSIPVFGDYPVLNLSHAVSIILYEFRCTGDLVLRHPKEFIEPATSSDIMSFLQNLKTFLVSFGYYEKPQRQTHASLMERIVRRLKPSKEELRFIQGVFRAHNQFLNGYTSVDPPTKEYHEDS